MLRHFDAPGGVEELVEMKKMDLKRTRSNAEERKSLLRFISVLFGAVFLFSTVFLGCDIVKEKPSIMTDIEKELGKEVSPETSSESSYVEYKTFEESKTLKIIAVHPHADLKVLGQQLANEAKDKALFEVDVYDDENEARNYRVRFDPNITSEDAALEDNEDALVAIYKKNTNKGENYIEIYHDIAREDVEIIRF